MDYYFLEMDEIYFTNDEQKLYHVKRSVSNETWRRLGRGCWFHGWEELRDWLLELDRKKIEEQRREEEWKKEMRELREMLARWRRDEEERRKEEDPPPKNMAEKHVGEKSDGGAIGEKSVAGDVHAREKKKMGTLAAGLGFKSGPGAGPLVGTDPVPIKTRRNWPSKEERYVASFRNRAKTLMVFCQLQGARRFPARCLSEKEEKYRLTRCRRGSVLRSQGFIWDPGGRSLNLEDKVAFKRRSIDTCEVCEVCTKKNLEDMSCQSLLDEHMRGVV